MSSSPLISVILTAWNRPQYLEEQVNAVLSQTIKPHEIVIWYNQPTKKLGIIRRKQLINFKNSNKVKKIICDYNFGIIPRFSMASCLDGEYICVFDDDTIPGNKWFENCLQYVDKKKCMLGTIGLTFLSLDKPPVKTKKPRMGWEAKNEKLEFVDLIGHSWFFRKEWAKYFWIEEPLLKTFGEDIHFCAMLQKYGIRTACPPHPQSDRSLWGSLYPERGIDKVAISSKNIDRDYYDVICHEVSKGFKAILL
ncbi:Glycosyltransferase 2-like domain-containing protein [Candidatus Magnetomoraceae bacterium gMMP-15]